MTRKLLKEYSSKLDLSETTTAMEELYRYMANGEDGHPAVNEKKKNQSSNETELNADAVPLIKGSSAISIVDLLEFLISFVRKKHPAGAFCFPTNVPEHFPCGDTLSSH